ncbi:helix-turn-helix domain-containing protein [Rubrobacter calidifluminis]|uniref:helix-turn-helix domain-containing protein n=1 Tax=Rubrobacter calidifluminis TaxID=1392640 RepID=UPI0023606C70|nr:helix-turn-helix domain-containing protein [Rubrobacter calidifluminis]
MGNFRKVTEEERQRIISLLKSGLSQGKTAREVGRSKQTVSRIARAAGISSDVTAIKKAEAARLDFAKAERLELLNEGFQKAREILPTVDSAHKLQAWMTALGIAVDKRRLEDGEATERGDYTHREAAEKDLEEYFEALDALREGDGEADTQ